MSDLTLTITRDMNARPETVWRCMTEPDLLKQWFAPDPVSVTQAIIDPVPGGIFHVVMKVPDMGRMDGGAGCVLVAVPHRQLVWTSALRPGFGPNPSPDAGAFHFTAIIDLEPTSSGGTLYRATALHADDAARAAHAAMGFDTGWGTTAQQLDNLASSLEP